MIRRNHKKSRFGCANCKKRHQKCDESRPTCVACRTAQEECSYARSSPNETSNLVRNRRAPVAAHAPRNTGVESRDGWMRPSTSAPTPKPTRDPEINFTLAHFSLFHRYLQNPDKIFGIGFVDQEEGNRLMLKYALKYPYLMSITLAVTALRQTMDEPRNAATLCDQATELFGRGISDLNIAIQNIHEGNIGAIFLSSSMTGKYMLCDTFIVQRQESPGAFLNRIIDTMRVARGVRAIMNDGHYILLAGSELRPMLGFNLQDIFDVDDDEDDEMMHFRALYELVKQSSLAEDEMEACRVAIAQLMRTYCSKSSSLHLRRASRFIRGRAWPIATTPLFTDMLERRVPEALVILGHWSVLLHCISDIWAIGDAPNLLMDCVRVALGTSWDGHLAWARDFISRPVPDTLL